MNKNQVNDSRDEAKGDAGEAAGNNPSNADTGKNGAPRGGDRKSRPRFGGLGEHLAKTM